MGGRRLVRWPATVRVRLSVLAALVVAVGLVASSAAVVTLVRHNLVANVHNETMRRAYATVALVATASLAPTLPSTGEDTAVVQVVDRRGTVLAASEELRGNGPLLTRWPDAGELVTTQRLPQLDDEADYVVVGLAVDRPGGPVAVYAAGSLDPVGDGVAATATALALVDPTLLVLAATITWLLVGRALQPVEAMRRQVAEITASELDRRVPVPAKQDELGRLARTMNEMLQRLQEAHDHQQRFVGDASHELRSPLAVIRTRLEVGLAHRADTDWPRLAQTVHRESARLEHLVDDLLLLSRDGAPRDAGPDQPDEVDLDELVLLEVEALRARGDVTVDLAPLFAARLPGRPDELRRVVRNLLDNAERHARRTVTVGIAVDGDAAELTVADDGDGVPPEYAERIFERFFRLQGARDRHSGGAGLGLAIVHDVVARHGGRTWLAPTAAGAKFHVRLPMARPSNGA